MATKGRINPAVALLLLLLLSFNCNCVVGDDGLLLLLPTDDCVDGKNKSPSFGIVVDGKRVNLTVI